MTTNTSLNYYSSRNPLNARIAENMLDVTSMQEGFVIFEKKACFCFSKAYEICKELIEESPVSVWKVPDYYNSATFLYFQGDLSTIMKAVTISIVLILSEHFDEKWRQDNLKFLEKLKDGLNNLQLSNEKNEDALHKSIMRFKGIKSACINAYETLRRGTDIDYVIPFEEFSTKNINDTRISVTGENNITSEELKKVIEDAVKDAFDKHKKEIDEEEITNEDIKKAWEQALANAKAEIESKIPRFEYNEKNEGLKIITGSDNHNNRNYESLEEIIKTTVKKYLDEEIEASDADIDEIFADIYGKDFVDQVNREMAAENGNKEADNLKRDNQTTTTAKNLQQQLDEARKTIEEKTQTLNEQQRIIDDYTAKYDPKQKGKEKHHILTGKQHVILYLAVLAHHNRIPNARENLSWELSLIAGRAESYMKRMLKEAITQEECDKTAKLFHETTPFIEGLIKALPQKLKGDKSEKNRKKVLKDKQN